MQGIRYPATQGAAESIRCYIYNYILYRYAHVYIYIYIYIFPNSELRGPQWERQQVNYQRAQGPAVATLQTEHAASSEARMPSRSRETLFPWA